MRHRLLKTRTAPYDRRLAGSHQQQVSSPSLGICIAAFLVMGAERLCDHCEGILTSKAYRVISEDPERGGILLEMIVFIPAAKKRKNLA